MTTPKLSKPALPGFATDDTMITGVREAALAGAAHGSGAGETLSGRERSTQESWPAEDQPESELPVPAGQLIDGKYTVERLMAEGGMGVVCLGRHVQLERPVAIKFLRRALSGRPAIVQRFLNEARALAALRSEHVVSVMDVGQLESGRPYLVMEHLDGIDLDALLERDGPLSVERAIGYILQICEPLAEAHALGIVHRDIKPENLFLWSGGPTADSVKVLDFGLAKQLGSSRALGVTGPQDSIGSPCYMSPEQVSTPQLVDSRTDIWSVGVVLYRLVTNTTPFDGDSLVQVLSHILAATPVPLPDASPHLDDELNAIVLRCLQKSPENRYQTMSQLSDALSAYLATRSSSRAEPTADGRRSKRPAAEDELKIVGVHSRWPAITVGLAALFAVAVYGADRTGHIRVRDLTDRWLTPARLAADAASSEPAPYHPQPLPFFRQVANAAAIRDSNGALTLQALPEPERTSLEPPTVPLLEEPMSQQERARKQAAYSDYLESEGLTRIPTTPDDTP
jgi:serine/threonine protein kinase